MHSPNDIFSALLFPGQTKANASFFQTQIAQLQAMPVHDQLQQQWIEQATANYNHSYGDEALRRQREILRDYGVDSAAQYNAIVQILDLHLLQQASPVMQHMIMACPEIDKLYQNQCIDGYSATYVRDANSVRERQYAVLDGVVLEDGDYVTHHTDILEDDANKLTLYEKNDTLLTWEAALLLIADGYDPTNVSGD